MSYWYFIKDKLRVLSFGFLMAFLSGPGQTHFIGIFGSSIQADFALNTASWGQLYMLATLMSAAIITWSGSLIDKFSLSGFSSVVIFGLAAACLLMSQIPTSWVWLVVVVFLLRQFGQGLTSLTSQTAMVRAFREQRGKALALTAVGFTLGEATLPALALFSIDSLGWRGTLVTTSAILVCFIPLVWWLIRQFDQKNRQAISDDKRLLDTQIDTSQYQYTRSEVLRDARFYLLIPTVMAPSLIITALFFFPGEIATAQGWSVQAITGHYWLFSLVTVAVSIYAGSLIDQFNAKFVTRLLLLPITFALLTLASSNSLWALWLYMVLLGVGSGINYTVGAALFAELYGTQHFGSIKALANMITVFASALGPAFVGVLLNNGVSFGVTCIYMAIGTIIAYVMMWQALRINVKNE